MLFVANNILDSFLSDKGEKNEFGHASKKIFTFLKTMISQCREGVNSMLFSVYQFSAHQHQI